MGRRNTKTTEADPYSAENPFERPAAIEVAVHERVEPGAASRIALKALRWVPSHRDTRSGRRNASQLKAGLVLIAVLFGGFGENGFHMSLAASFMLAALFLPVTDGRKREWRTRLQGRGARVRRVESRAAQVRYDGRRVAVLSDGKVWRRVLVDRSEHGMAVRADDGAAWLGLVPPSGRKAESLWLVARDETLRRELPAATEVVDEQRVDAAVVVDAATWRELEATLTRWTAPRRA
jgi:hypothetical protein